MCELCSLFPYPLSLPYPLPDLILILLGTIQSCDGAIGLPTLGLLGLDSKEGGGGRRNGRGGEGDQLSKDTVVEESVS